jgi:hypothetical protein
MARNAHEREDLLRDARALVPRIMLRLEIDGRSVDVLAGFRGEALSLYFGEDPALHFNTHGELRRAFVDNQLIKAEGGGLVALTATRSESRTELLAAPFEQLAELRLLTQVGRLLSDLRAALADRRFVVVGQVPDESDAITRLERWLADRSELRIARSPRVAD